MKNKIIWIIVLVVIIIFGVTTYSQQNKESANENATGYVTAAYTSNGKNYIDIDYITIKNGDSNMPWGTIANDNSKIRTFEVSTDVRIKLLNDEIDGVMVSGDYIIDFTKFKNIFNSNSESDFRRTNPWDITVQNGIIVEIVENFRS